MMKEKRKDNIILKGKSFEDNSEMIVLFLVVFSLIPVANLNPIEFRVCLSPVPPADPAVSAVFSIF